MEDEKGIDSKVVLSPVAAGKPRLIDRPQPLLHRRVAQVRNNRHSVHRTLRLRCIRGRVGCCVRCRWLWRVRRRLCRCFGWRIRRRVGDGWGLGRCFRGRRDRRGCWHNAHPFHGADIAHRHAVAIAIHRPGSAALVGSRAVSRIAGVDRRTAGLCHRAGARDPEHRHREVAPRAPVLRDGGPRDARPRRRAAPGRSRSTRRRSSRTRRS